MADASSLPAERERSALLQDAMRFVSFTDDDLDMLRSLASQYRPRIPEMCELFYSSLMANPAAMRVFSGPGQIDRLKGTLARWAEELFTERRDAAYAEKRIRIGAVHVEIGVETKFILGAMGIIRSFLMSTARQSLPADSAEAAMESISRACDLDLILMTESYEFSRRVRDLEEANDRLRRVLQQAPVAVIGYDAEGTIVDWNNAAEELYGYARHEAFGRKLLDLLILPGDRDLVVERFKRVFAGESLGPFDAVHRDKAGKHLRLILAHAAIRGPRGIDEGVAFVLDRTEISLLRERMVEREKIAAMGTLAAGLAHEVGNPLASISAICQLIEKKGDDGRLKERIRTVREAIDRIDAIVRRVLEFARSKGGSDIERLDLQATVKDVLNLVGLDRRVKRMSVSERVPGDLPAVRAQRTGMAQVLLNLILNAAEACQEGDRIEILGHEKDGGVSLVVQDSGPGFTGEALHRAVEPFYTTKDYGSGLGLAISYSIVERSGGRLLISNAESTEGGGGRVEIWLPLAG